MEDEQNFFKAMETIGPDLSEWSRVKGWFLGGTLLNPEDPRPDREKPRTGVQDFLYTHSYGDGEDHTVPPEALLGLAESLSKGGSILGSNRPLKLAISPDSIAASSGIQDNHLPPPCTVTTCAEYQAAIKEESYAYTTFDMTMEAFFKQACGILDAYEGAQVAEHNHLTNVVITLPRHLPASASACSGITRPGRRIPRNGQTRRHGGAVDHR